MKPKAGNALIAEALGTFTLVLVGCAAAESGQGVVAAASQAISATLYLILRVSSVAGLSAGLFTAIC